MARSRRNLQGLGVDWFLPVTKPGAETIRYAARAFASTTRASAELIEALAADRNRDGSDPTWLQIAQRILFDDEAKRIAEGFVAHGHGEQPAWAYLMASLAEPKIDDIRV